MWQIHLFLINYKLYIRDQNDFYDHCTLKELTYLNFRNTALAGVAPWIECWSVNQKAAGSIPSQGTCLVVGQVSTWGRARDNQLFLLHTDVPLPLSLPSPLCDNK